MDGLTFSPYSEKTGDTAKLFSGNTDRDTIVKHMLDRSIEARYVRIMVVEGGAAGIGLRFNLIGCLGYVFNSKIKNNIKPSTAPYPVND